MNEEFKLFIKKPFISIGDNLLKLQEIRNLSKVLVVSNGEKGIYKVDENELNKIEEETRKLGYIVPPPELLKQLCKDEKRMSRKEIEEIRAIFPCYSTSSKDEVYTVYAYQC